MLKFIIMNKYICLLILITYSNCSIFPGSYTEVPLNTNDMRINEVIMTIEKGLNESNSSMTRFHPIASKYN